MFNKYVVLKKKSVYLSLVYPIDKGSLVDIMYLDFQKVFDKVPHQRLLLKLKAHGIRDGIIDKMDKMAD